MNSSSILVVGSVNIDLILKCDYVPLEGESAYGEDYRYSFGGKGANQAVACARLNEDVTFVGCVGNDEHGVKLAKNLKNEGINTDFLYIDKDTTTGMAVVMVEGNGKNRILSYSGANASASFEQLEKAFEMQYDAVVLQFELDQDIVVECCRIADSKNIPIVIDAGPAQKFDLSRLPRPLVFSPNETEATALTGMSVDDDESVEKVAAVLKDMTDAEIVLMKLGKRGCYCLEDSKGKFFGTYPVPVVDSTAAGDSFTAAFTSGYIKTKDTEYSIKFATAAASLTVTKSGAQDSLPTLKEIEEFLEERKQEVI